MELNYLVEASGAQGGKSPCCDALVVGHQESLGC